jgi:hypothetical protein
MVTERTCRAGSRVRRPRESHSQSLSAVAYVRGQLHERALLPRALMIQNQMT